MLQVRSVKYNFIMNVILTASTIIFPLITFPYVSRILLPAGVGKVNFATSVVSYFSMFAMLGVPTYGIRACAQVRDDREELSRTVQEILILNMLVSCVVYLVYFFAVWNIPRMRSDFPLFMVMSSTILFNVIGVEWLYKGLEQYSYITFRSIIFKFISLILMFAFVRDSEDYIVYGAISIVASVGSNILNFLNLRKYVDLRTFRKLCLRRHLKPVMVFFMMSVATTVYTNMDTVMLGFMKDDTEVGYYTAAVKVKGILVSFVTALSTVLLPRVSYYIEHDMQEKFSQVGRKALNFVMVAAVPLVAYFTVFARESILLLSGEEFVGAVLPMQVIMLTVLFIGLTNVLGIQILVPIGKEKLVFYSVLTGAVVDLVINILCIPSMASAGAALGTVIAELAVLIVQILFLKEYIVKLFKNIQIWKILLAVAAAVSVSYPVKLIDFPVLYSLLLSAILFYAIYGGVLLVVREKLVCNMVEELMDKLPWQIRRRRK